MTKIEKMISNIEIRMKTACLMNYGLEFPIAKELRKFAKEIVEQVIPCGDCKGIKFFKESCRSVCINKAKNLGLKIK